MIEETLEKHSETFFIKIILRKVENGMKYVSFSYIITFSYIVKSISL